MVLNKIYRDQVIKPMLSTFRASRSQNKVTHGGLSWMNCFLQQLVRQRCELRAKGALSLKKQERGGLLCPPHQPEQLQDGWNRAGLAQASRHQPCCAAWLHPHRGAGTLLRGPMLPTHTQVLWPHNLLSPLDLWHGAGPPWLLNLQTLCQLVELLLLAKPWFTWQMQWHMIKLQRTLAYLLLAVV